MNGLLPPRTLELRVLVTKLRDQGANLVRPGSVAPVGQEPQHRHPSAGDKHAPDLHVDPVCEHCRVEPEPITKADFDAITESLPAFWGERDPVELHHPMFVHEFGDGALLIRDEQGAVAAYLFGFFLAERKLAYVHLVAVRGDRRGLGLARVLYEHFWQLARKRGCERVKAIARPENTASIALHRAMGMEAVETPDYSGPGRARVVFRAQLND